MKKLLLLLIIGLMISSGVQAVSDAISMSSEQSDYYFLTGTDDRIPFIVNSSYPNTLVGTLQYTLTRNQEGGGFTVSQSSTQSQSFPVAPGRSEHALSLSSSEPTEYDVDLSLSYTDKGRDYAVTLPTLKVHFVSDQKGIQQRKSTVRSSTSEVPQSQSSSQNSMDRFDQEMEGMRQQQEQMMQQFMNSGTGMSSSSLPASQNPSQALQNNQMSSSASSLQKQMARESQETKQNQQALADSLSEDPLIKEQAAELQAAGYNQTSGKVVPTGKNQGEIQAEYTHKNGSKVSLSGTAKDNTVQTLSAETSGEVPVSSVLSSNATWNDIKNDLAAESLKPENGTITRTPGKTEVTQSYTAPDGRNATLSARIVNGTVTDIILVKDEAFPLFWFIGILLLIILVLLCAGVLWWYFLIRKEEGPGVELVTPEDMNRKVQEMIKKGEDLFISGEQKEGYVMLGQALRLYLSYEYGRGESLTCEEAVSDIRGLLIPDKQIVTDILTTCSLVEYAREEPDEPEFMQILDDIKNLVKKGSNP